MKKLEDIPRQSEKSMFKVPDGYFEQLPNVIQSRMMKEDRRAPVLRVVSFSLKVVLPLVVLVAAGLFWFRPSPAPELRLDDVDTEQIALYLNNIDHLDLEDVNDTNGWTKQELDQLEDTIYSNIEYSNEDILNDVDLDNL
jgi:hypothetical protein